VLPETSEFWKGAAEAPESVGGTIGRFGEQAAEMMVPMSKVSTAAKALPAAGRIAAEAAAAGGIAGVQSGGDPTAMALAAGTQGVFGGIGAASGVGRTSSPVNNWLKESGQRQYKQAILQGGGKESTKELAERITPELIKRGETAFTLKGLDQKAANNVIESGIAIGNAFDSLPATARIDVASVEKAIESASNKAFRNTIPSTGEMVLKGQEAAMGERHVNRILKTLADHAEIDPATGERFITAQNARSLRQYYDEVLSNSNGFTKDVPNASKAAAHKMAGTAMREELAKTFPDIAKLNKEYSFWKDVQEITGETLFRKQGHGKGIGNTVKEAAGAVIGGQLAGPAGIPLGAAAFGALNRITSSTAWRTVSAVQKEKLANALAKGNRGEAERLIRMISATVTSATARNRTNQQPEEQEQE
jgi:hypothetical protein